MLHVPLSFRCLPTPEEAELLRNYEGERSSLAPVERFMLELLSIPQLEAKLNLLVFKAQVCLSISLFLVFLLMSYSSLQKLLKLLLISMFSCVLVMKLQLRNDSLHF